MMLLKDLIKKGVETVSAAYPDGEAREMVFAFLEDHIGTKKHTHIVEPGCEVSDDIASQVMEAFRRMASGEPLQYVTGFADFYGRRFRVNSDVLIPRPETELLCRYVLDDSTICADFQDMSLSARGCPRRGRGSGESAHTEGPKRAGRRILDLCTGSGCIAWTLALEMPVAEVTAVDISDGALAVASAQDFAEEIALTGAHAPDFIKADVLAGPWQNGQKFDIIVSNPPYVMDKEKAFMRTNVLEYEPHLALFVPDEDPLIFYRAVARWASRLLSPDGFGLVEINEALGPQTVDVFREAGFSYAEVLDDLASKDRFVLFRY